MKYIKILFFSTLLWLLGITGYYFYTNNKIYTARGEGLIIYCVKGEIKDVKELLNSGADVNYQSKYKGYTPLHWAVYDENIPLIELLVKKGANINIQCDTGSTPLHVSGYEWRKKGQKIQKILLQSKYKPNWEIKNKKGCFPIKKE